MAWASYCSGFDVQLCLDSTSARQGMDFSLSHPQGQSNVHITRMRRIALISIALCWFGRVGPAMPCAWLPQERSGLSKAGDVLSSHSCREVFSGKVFKTRAAGERGGNRRESAIRRFCAYVGFKEWGTPAELLGTASQANEDISRWVHYSHYHPRGQPLSMGRNTVFPTGQG